MPNRDRVGRFKAPIRCLRGAISFQSKANELPQSTRQVLINIHAFTFKSRPIYRSFPSICETWKIHAELLFEGGPHGEEYYGGYYGTGGVGSFPKCLESDKLHIQCKHAAAAPCAVPGDEAELQPAPKSQYWTCVGGQIPHYCHCHRLPDLLLHLNIKYLAKLALPLCTIIDPESPSIPRFSSRSGCRRHRSIPMSGSIHRGWQPLIIDQSVRCVCRGETRQTRPGTTQLLLDGPPPNVDKSAASV